MLHKLISSKKISIKKKRLKTFALLENNQPVSQSLVKKTPTESLKLKHKCAQYTK